MIRSLASGFCYSGHKEGILAKEAAEKLSAVFDTNIVLTADIHWNDIDEEEIKIVMNNSKTLINQIIKMVKQDR